MAEEKKAQLRHEALEILVNISLDNGWVSSGTKPLPSLMLVAYQWDIVVFICRPIQQNMALLWSLLTLSTVEILSVINYIIFISMA